MIRTRTMEYELIRSRRKSISVEIKQDGRIIVRAPLRLPKREIERFLLEKQEARRGIPGRVAHFAPLVGVTYGRVTIRCQKTRWGSCSSSGNLNFNCLLLLAPPEVLDYVVVHELCHRKEMNHSPRFWAEVGRVLPDYKKRNKWLKENGSRLMLLIRST